MEKGRGLPSGQNWGTATFRPGPPESRQSASGPNLAFALGRFAPHFGRPVDYCRFSKADVHPKGAYGYDGWKADIRSSRLHVASPPTSDIRNATSEVATEIILQMDKSWANFEILKGLDLRSSFSSAWS